MSEPTDFTVDGKDSLEELAEAARWHAENMENYAAEGNERAVRSSRKKLQEHLDCIKELQDE
jgi:hypothetical protein